MAQLIACSVPVALPRGLLEILGLKIAAQSARSPSYLEFSLYQHEKFHVGPGATLVGIGEQNWAEKLPGIPINLPQCFRLAHFCCSFRKSESFVFYFPIKQPCAMDKKRGRGCRDASGVTALPVRGPSYKLRPNFRDCPPSSTPATFPLHG